MVEAIDTYFLFVKSQMAKLDPTQRFGPIVASRDWPQTPPKDSTLYLLYLSSTPISPGTASVTFYQHMLQWVWLVMGDDIEPTERKQNRGDRYRVHLNMQNNLQDANYPGFCQKMAYTADRDGNLSSNGFTLPEYGGAETIFWTTPRFIPRFDAERSGLLYGVAAVEVDAWEDITLKLQQPYPQPVLTKDVRARIDAFNRS